MTDAKPGTFKINEGSTDVNLNDTTFKVESGSGDVTVYAEKVRAKIPGKAATKEITDRSVDISDDQTKAKVYGAVLEAAGEDLPAVTTTGVIRPRRPASPAPALTVVKAPAVAVVADKIKEVLPTLSAGKDSLGKAAEKATGAFAQTVKQTIADLAELDVLPPKTNFSMGDDTGDGWICVETPSRLKRALFGAQPVKVVKFVGEVSHATLAGAAKTEQTNKALQNVHIPAEDEVRSIFNTVTKLIGQTASSLQAVWVDNAYLSTTAVSLTAQGKSLDIRRTRANKNAGILFATLKP